MVFRTNLHGRGALRSSACVVVLSWANFSQLRTRPSFEIPVNFGKFKDLNQALPNSSYGVPASERAPDVQFRPL